MLILDHIAISAETLDDGVAWVEDRLGVVLAGGGKHPQMATHNRLLGLGDLYLEVIATDPAAPRPASPRCFDLDRFSGPPRLTNWVARCDDLDAEVALSPPGIGVPAALARGDLQWHMAVPVDGILPFDGCFPALIQWQDSVHPASRLPDVAVRIIRLILIHPQADDLRNALSGRLVDPRVVVEQGTSMAIKAEFATPHGTRLL